MADLVVGDTRSTVKYKLRNRTTGIAIDLTDASSVVFSFKIGIAATKVRLMTIEAPTAGGVVSYQFVDGDLEPGLLEGEVYVLWPGNPIENQRILHSADTVRYLVRPQL